MTKKFVFAYLACSLNFAFGFTPMITTNDYRFTPVYSGYKWLCEDQVCKPNDRTLRMEDLVFINEAVHERLAFYYGFHEPQDSYWAHSSYSDRVLSPFGGNLLVDTQGGLPKQIIANGINPRAYWGLTTSIEPLSRCNHWNQRYLTPFFVLSDCPASIMNYSGRFFEYDMETEVANDFVGDYSPYSVITNDYALYGVETELNVETITNNFPSMEGRNEIFVFLGKFTRMVFDTHCIFKVNDNGGKISSNFKYVDYEKTKGMNYWSGDFLDSRTEDDAEHKYRIWSPKSADGPTEDTEEDEQYGILQGVFGLVENDSTTYQLWNLKETFDRNWSYQYNDFNKSNIENVKSVDYRKQSWDGDIYMEFGNENTVTGSIGRVKYDIASIDCLAIARLSYYELTEEGTNVVSVSDSGGISISQVTTESEEGDSFYGEVLVPVTMTVGFFEDEGDVKVLYAKTSGLSYDEVEGYCCDSVGISPIVYAEDSPDPTNTGTPNSPISFYDCGGWASKYKSMEIVLTGEILADISDIKFDTEIVDESSDGGGDGNPQQ